MLTTETLIAICEAIYALISLLTGYLLIRWLGRRRNALGRKREEKHFEVEADSVTSVECEVVADPDSVRNWKVVPLKVAYMIYAIPLFVLVGIIFVTNTTYDLLPHTTVLCFTFPLSLSILIITMLSILQ